jgi:hypothetical protein
MKFAFPPQPYSPNTDGFLFLVSNVLKQRMGWDSSGEDSPSGWIHGVCDATPLAAWIYVCLAACGGNRSETVFGGHSQHTASTRDFTRR